MSARTIFQRIILIRMIMDTISMRMMTIMTDEYDFDDDSDDEDDY
jgi:hypothetical protein